MNDTAHTRLYYQPIKAFRAVIDWTDPLYVCDRLHPMVEWLEEHVGALSVRDRGQPINGEGWVLSYEFCSDDCRKFKPFVECNVGLVSEAEQVEFALLFN